MGCSIGLILFAALNRYDSHPPDGSKAVAQEADAPTSQPQSTKSQLLPPEVDPAEPKAKAANLELVYARSLSVVPGAIVCPNANATSDLFELYSTAWSERDDTIVNFIGETRSKSSFWKVR